MEEFFFEDWEKPKLQWEELFELVTKFLDRNLRFNRDELTLEELKEVVSNIWINDYGQTKYTLIVKVKQHLNITNEYIYDYDHDNNYDEDGNQDESDIGTADLVDSCIHSYFTDELDFRYKLLKESIDYDKQILLRRRTKRIEKIKNKIDTIQKK